MSNKLSTAPAAKTQYGLTATTLKMIAVICMFIDHIGAFVVYRLINSKIWHTDNVLFTIDSDKYTIEIVIYYLLRAIGRISFPIFCFFIVEGYRRTRSKIKYAFRLLFFALLSEAPFTMAAHGTMLEWWKYLTPSNVFFTLLIGLIVIWGADELKKYAPGGFVAVCFRILVCIIPTGYAAYEVNSILSIFEEMSLGPNSFVIIWGVLALAMLIGTFVYGLVTTKENARVLSSSLSILSLGMVLADILGTDYAGYGVIVIFVINLFMNRKRTTGIALGIGALILFNLSEIPALADIYLLSRYNGERGKGYKYFFYLFYPVHLAVIALVMFLTGLI